MSNETNQTQPLNWDAFTTRVADHYVSRLTQAEITEIKHAFYLVSENQVTTQDGN